MKVNIDQTLNVTDEQRKEIARHIDGNGAKSRDATRDEMKNFIWRYGSSWEQALEDEVDDAPDDDDEDLIGGGDDPSDEDLI